MKALLQHLWRENRAQIIERSRFNCHTVGLHSLMLLEAPGRTIRAFVACSNHDLFLNTPKLMEHMSIGFHPHHCNLTLQVAAGKIENWIVAADELEPTFHLGEFEFQSALATGKDAAFTRVRDVGLRTIERRVLARGDSIAMDAENLHTVFVPQWEVAVWFVFEGQENPAYRPACFSPRALDRATFNHLYLRPTEEQVAQLMNSILLTLS